MRSLSQPCVEGRSRRSSRSRARTSASEAIEEAPGLGVAEVVQVEERGQVALKRGPVGGLADLVGDAAAVQGALQAPADPLAELLAALGEVTLPVEARRSRCNGVSAAALLDKR